jgi:hypothetical protein
MQRRDGSFWNYLDYNREYRDEGETEDAFGRTIWALGYFHRHSPNESFRELTGEILNRARACFPRLRSLRGMANTMIGICHLLRGQSDNEELRGWLADMARKMSAAYESERREDWMWFEPILCYDNGILPYALLYAYEFLEEEGLREIACEAMGFLEKTTLSGEHLTLVGCEGWYRRGGSPARFAQQPVDAMAMVLMYNQAAMVMKDTSYLEKMYKAFLWFLGDNDAGVPIYDFETGGCCDGLDEHGVSRNQGAESTIAYHMAHLTVLFAYEYISFYGASSSSKSSAMGILAKPEE